MEERRKYSISVKAKDYNPANNFRFNNKEIYTSNLRDIVKNCNYSLITWKGNTRKAENFKFAVGGIIDIDNGLTIEKATERLKKKNLNYFIASSKRHKKESNRYHILIFFNYPVYCDSTYKQILQDITKIFPEADKSVIDSGRFIFGSPDDCEIHEFWNGEDFDVTGYSGLWDRSLQLLNKNEERIVLSEKMNKTPIFCPFHEDESPSAFVSYSNNNYFIHCSACDHTFWMFENREDWLSRKCKDFYSYGTDVFEFSMINDSFAFNKIGKNKFHVFTDTDTTQEIRKEAWEYLLLNKHIRQLCTIDYISDIYADKSYYEDNLDLGVFSVHHKALPVKIKDNEFIESYLDDRFGEYRDFIKQWMAVYTYTNYKKLPTLIFSGPRGSGKSSFAEIIAKIFSSLSNKWTGMESSFSYEVEKKFLIVEENTGDKLTQYKTLKNYSGSKEVEVKKKFKDPYLVKNNMNICLLSNEVIPLFVRSEEQPTDSKNNQFFVYEFPELTGAIDPQIQDRIVERLGHYIRTELKPVFDSLNTSGYRYSIDVPITECEKALFINNKTEADHEVDELVSKMIDEKKSYNHIGDFIKEGYLPSAWIKEIFPYKKHTIVKTLIKSRLIDGSAERKQVGNTRESCYKMTALLIEKLKEDDPKHGTLDNF